MTAQRPIHQKPMVFRRAAARGDLALSARTRTAIRAGRVEKGDPLNVGELAGLAAIKRTSDLIPHCHTVPLTGSRVTVTPTERGVRASAEVEAVWRTGVEMEALVGVTVALLTVWDMVKYLEKDRRGLYPTARLGPVKVIEKVKRAFEEPS